MFYIGGELAQSRLGLPKSLTGVFRGCCCSPCRCDTLIYYRVAAGNRRAPRAPRATLVETLATVANNPP